MEEIYGGGEMEGVGGEFEALERRRRGREMGGGRRSIQWWRAG